MESPVHLRRLPLFLKSKETPEMPARVTRHLTSALDQAAMLCVGSWEGRIAG